MKQVAYITGASSGIGYALAVELSQKGYLLALAARRKDLLEELAGAVNRSGGDAVTIACDVGDQVQVKQAVTETLNHFGSIDLAILSAGVGRPTDAANFNAAKFERLARTNLLGVAYCLEELIPVMRKQGGGRLILTRIARGDRVIRFPLIPSMFMKMMRVLPVSVFDAITANRRPVRTDAANKFE